MSEFCGECGAAIQAQVRFCESCGHPVRQPGADEQHGPDEQPGPEDPTAEASGSRPRRGRVPTPLLVAGSTLCVLVLVFVGLWLVQVLVFSPTATVKGFFGDLAGGDAVGATGRLVSGSARAGSDATPTSRALLTDEVLDGAGYVAPTDVQVTEAAAATASEGVKRFDVSYRVGGKQQKTRMIVRKSAHRALWIFDTWEIKQRLPSVVVAAGLPHEVNGVAVDDPLKEAKIKPGTEAPDRVAYVALPGSYRVGIAKNPLVSNGKPKRVSIGVGRRNVEAMFQTAVKPSAKREVKGQVKAEVDRCAKSHSLNPKHCPFATYAEGEVSNVKWTVLNYPEPHLDQSDTGSVYMTTTQGGTGNVKVSYDGKNLLSGAPEPVRAHTRIGVGGPVVVEDGKIKWMSPRRYAGG